MRALFSNFPGRCRPLSRNRSPSPISCGSSTRAPSPQERTFQSLEKARAKKITDDSIIPPPPFFPCSLSRIMDPSAPLCYACSLDRSITHSLPPFLFSLPVKRIPIAYLALPFLRANLMVFPLFFCPIPPVSRVPCPMSLTYLHSSLVRSLARCRCCCFSPFYQRSTITITFDEFLILIRSGQVRSMNPKPKPKNYPLPIPILQNKEKRRACARANNMTA